MIGNVTHRGLQEWYTSRCRDGEDTGEPNLYAAIDAMDAMWLTRSSEFADQKQFEPARATTRQLLRRWDDYYGPGGLLAEYPGIKVLFDAHGEPVIERYYELPIPNHPPYTCRIDLGIVYRGRAWARDFKTADARWWRKEALMANMSSQFTGQLAALSHNEPDWHAAGIRASYLIKDRKTGPPFEEVLVNRSPQALALFPHHLEHDFSLIESMKAKFELLQLEGMPMNEAFNIAFPMWGQVTGVCTAYFRKCEFWDLCQAPTMSEGLIKAGFKARRVVEDPEITGE
jgi:hypothetical protein